jgi:hypothetical protein
MSISRYKNYPDLVMEFVQSPTAGRGGAVQPDRPLMVMPPASSRRDAQQSVETFSRIPGGYGE